MYSSKYDSEFKNETNFSKRTLIWIVGFVVVVSVVGFFMSRSVDVVDNGIVHYEEFQEIYNTCQKINTDLATVRAVDEKDRMFDQFSKNAQIAQKRQQMSRWVEEYNGKSRMINRSIWKSSSLPYQLSTDQFSNYDK